MQGTLSVVSFVDEVLGAPRAWMRDALCAEHPEVNFFPERGDDLRPAKRLCARCMVRAECAASVEGEKLPGIWGGLSEVERKRRRRADLERVAA